MPASFESVLNAVLRSVPLGPNMVEIYNLTCRPDSRNNPYEHYSLFKFKRDLPAIKTGRDLLWETFLEQTSRKSREQLVLANRVLTKGGNRRDKTRTC